MYSLNSGSDFNDSHLDFSKSFVTFLTSENREGEHHEDLHD